MTVLENLPLQKSLHAAVRAAIPGASDDACHFALWDHVPAYPFGVPSARDAYRAGHRVARISSRAAVVT